MWRDFIQNLNTDCEFRPAAPEIAILDTEAGLNLLLPESLKTFCQESNGLYSKFAYLSLVWSVEEILKRNIAMRENAQFAEIYMSFHSLLFFADAGVDGIMLAFPITAKGTVQDKNIIAWYPIEDSRPVLAQSLKDYLKRWFSGEFKL